MKRAAIAVVLAGAIALAGCDTIPTAPELLEVPVPVPCVERVPERPAFPADGLTGEEDIWTLATTLWADRLARRAYELRLETVVLACSKIAAK
jgi:hypothetical protein